MVFTRILLNIKHRSNATLKSWSYQFESILAQRSRRVQQLYTFYHHVYGAQGLKLLITSYRRRLPAFKGTNLVLSAVGAMGISLTNSPAFDWTNERLSLANFDNCETDLEFINTLSENELCELCKEKCMRYCYCSIGNRTANKYKTENSTRTYIEGNGVDGAVSMGKSIIKCESNSLWEPYFRQGEFSVWRREDANAMFSYKVYACFEDITAADFLHIQTDLEYRRKWDDSVVALHLIEEDPIPGNNSDVIYWELQWPKLFANRDYVFCRRFITDEKRKVMMIANRGTTHSQYPPDSSKVRVSNYWSFMVIKPYRSFHEPGVHYTLTYFDDPGLPIPQSIKSWVTQKRMPEFLQKMYVATKSYSYKRAIAINHVFTSFTKLNNEYKANASRESWMKRFLRNSNDLFKSNNNNNNKNNSNNNHND